jgi:hypothetical protein
MIQQRMEESNNQKKKGNNRRVVTNLKQLKEESSDWSSSGDDKKVKVKKPLGEEGKDISSNGSKGHMDKNNRSRSKSSDWSSDGKADVKNEKAPEETKEVDAKQQLSSILENIEGNKKETVNESNEVSSIHELMTKLCNGTIKCENENILKFTSDTCPNGVQISKENLVKSIEGFKTEEKPKGSFNFNELEGLSDMMDDEMSDLENELNSEKDELSDESSDEYGKNSKFT